ncbi:NAD-dependent epimerase/dehydratase family protein [Anaerophaga thermohalophila]|jgi:nucleoside-diphosphate-sugar epimerase|uniref:NAD-dependent epimerase/dehydratase family protein n=1 Tax=Anaerophaga thermohalophila TaxID=177400 RepID=UPI0002E5D5E6|nr:NAD-dependent epimerase/dehydratase family protein [Anaerophaga thermohalophila]
MKVLYIGGTGNISAASSRLAVKSGIDLYLLNRGTGSVKIKGATNIVADHSDKNAVAEAVKGQKWDVVVNWIAFTPEDVKRDFEIFKGHTRQYIFISSASAYQKPGGHPVITESTPLYNPYWQYSRDKIACEDYLTQRFRNDSFPITIVRPSLTYDTVIPVPLCGWKDFTIIERIRHGKEVIIHGDGTSLWTITHSEDFAKGFNGLLGHRQSIGHSFHITSDEIMTWNQIYEWVAEAAGAPLKAVHIPSDFIARFDEHSYGSLIGDKAQSVIFDNSKIKRFVPGFRAVIPFSEGIKRTIRWFEEEPGRIQIDPARGDLVDRIIGAYKQCFG